MGLVKHPLRAQHSQVHSNYLLKELNSLTECLPPREFATKDASSSEGPQGGPAPRMSQDLSDPVAQAVVTPGAQELIGSLCWAAALGP